MNKLEAIRQLEKLQKEVDKLKEIINKPDDLFSITSYSEVCKKLGIREKSLSDFDNLKEFRYHQIQNIETLFNEGWVRDWSNSNQYKWYPYFKYTNAGLVFSVSYLVLYSFYGQVSYFKDEKTSTYVGKTFIDIYKDLM